MGIIEKLRSLKKPICPSLLLIVCLASQALAQTPLQNFIEISEQPDEVATNYLDHTYTIFNSETTPEVQDLVDEAVSLIAETRLGQEINQYILGCEASAIESHLSVSHSRALHIADLCKTAASETAPSGFVTSSSSSSKEIHTLSHSPTPLKRRYSVVITDDDNWPYSSWTNASNNRTYLFLKSNAQGISAPWSLAVQMIAHEMAVYFDSKSLKQQGPLSPTFMALNNPVIHHNLTFMRAFAVEKDIIEQLVADSKLTLDKDEFYSAPFFSFLQPQIYSSQCAWENFKSHSHTFLPNILALITNSEGYHNIKSRIADLIHNDRLAQEMFSSHFERLNPLKRLLRFFSNSRKKSHHLKEILDVFNPHLKDITQSEHRQLKTALTAIVNKDLQAIHPYFLDQTPSIQHLARPQLSGTHVRKTSGPRPIIVTHKTEECLRGLRGGH